MCQHILCDTFFTGFGNVSNLIQTGSGNTLGSKSPHSALLNLRPIGQSLPFLFAKATERAVFKQVSEEFPLRNDLLDPNQSGFKSGHSTETALSSVTEALRAARAAAQSLVRIQIRILPDPSSAFYMVNPCILLSVPSNMGTSDKAHSWFESYLTGCSFQYVMARTKVHIPPPLHRGAPRLCAGAPSLCHLSATPPLWVRLSVRMASHITATQTIPNFTCHSHKKTPQSRRRSRLVSQRHPHG